MTSMCLFLQSRHDSVATSPNSYICLVRELASKELWFRLSGYAEAEGEPQQKGFRLFRVSGAHKEEIWYSFRPPSYPGRYRTPIIP